MTLKYQANTRAGYRVDFPRSFMLNARLQMPALFMPKRKWAKTWTSHCGQLSNKARIYKNGDANVWTNFRHWEMLYAPNGHLWTRDGAMLRGVCHHTYTSSGSIWPELRFYGRTINYSH